MPTQEERLTTLEKQFTALQQQAATHIQELDENTTILLGVIRHQGQDIRKIHQRLETIETSLSEHTRLLTEILERLPKNH
jgi:DNA repair exonuclease SbcCD ATPase subunit